MTTIQEIEFLIIDAVRLMNKTSMTSIKSGFTYDNLDVSFRINIKNKLKEKK
jgi:hypothetical protein